ncbi:hypothetical protein RIEGSTA812A_PEG_982 [invertebrate metagenome]|uniref:Uncharacterized protein n=1 Tax=invertebrate metagenome TaxID=1711999 RepID=A0A484H638_9ZZZZ
MENCYGIHASHNLPFFSTFSLPRDVAFVGRSVIMTEVCTLSYH